MGKRGPKPQPQQILKMTGSRKAASRPGEPEISPGVPVKPEWLTNEDASRLWDKLLPRLVQQGLMSELYGESLALLCEAYGDYLDAKRLIDENGPIAYSDKGSPYIHPAVNIKASADKRITTHLRQFGLSPSDVRDVTKVEQAQDALTASARKRG